MRASAALIVVLCALSLVAGGQGPARNQAQVPVDRQALVMLRVLAYDRNLPKRASGALTIAVVAGQTPESKNAQAAMVAALGEIAKESKVLGLPVKAVGVDASGPEPLEARLKAAGASVVYICQGVSTDEVRAITEAARRGSVLTFSGNEAHIDLGVGVAFVRRSARVVIVINRPVVSQAGAELAPELLQVAEIRGG
ncbi:MAG: YfiR family protein [Myxococcaceae bacterium]|nr:YfiR family protein [Myxococcaceae bacterium]MCI0672751.1 YfiR family protein [Myxococcaceae bacterium]